MPPSQRMRLHFLKKNWLKYIRNSIFQKGLKLLSCLPLPKKNPPFPSSIFPKRAKKIIKVISYRLVYYLDKWVYEASIGFMSIFSTDSKPSIIFIFSQFIADSIHEKFVKFPTEEVFKYASVLVYLFLYSQGDKFKFSLQKLDEERNKQSIIF